MSIETIKFSGFIDGGDLANEALTVGLSTGPDGLIANTYFNNPWTFLASGTTAERPAIHADMYNRLRFNTTPPTTYEYYDPILAAWVAIDDGSSEVINPGLINELAFYAAAGTTLSGLATAADGLLVTSATGVPSIGNTIGGALTVAGTVSSSALNVGASTLIDGVINDNTMATASVSSLATSASIKAYVDASHPPPGTVQTIVPTPNQILVDSSDPANPVVSLSTTVDTPGLFNIQSSTQVGSIIDDDTMATSSATSLATSASIKAYVDAHSGGGGNVGDFVDFGGTAPPTGCLVRNGQAVNRTTYADLFGVIGTTWGAGDGFSTFNLPNSERSVSVGSGGTGTATLGNSVGSTGGAETHTLTIAEMPEHQHSYGGTNAEGFTSGNSILSQGGSAFTTGVAGGGDPHSIMQPSVVMLPCIRWQASSSGSGSGGLKSIQVFTSSGIWTRPPNIVKIRVKVIGAGGGGGGVLGGPSSLYAASGGGGGGGGFSEKWVDVSGMTSQTVTVGALGLGGDGTIPNPGATGGTSFFGALCYAGGGVGGSEREAATEVTFTLGGAGGFGVNGDFNAPGSPGAFGMASPTGAQGISGMGGGSTISGGAPSAYAGNPTGRAGTGYGGGGSGGVTTSVANANGGNGAPGFILVWEYGG